MALIASVVSVTQSCTVPATVDTVGDALERAGRNLQSHHGVEAELEVLYEVDGLWVLLVVPRSGLDQQALADAGLAESAKARLAEAAPRWTGEQYLMQIRDDALLMRTLAHDAVVVDQQFILSGRGAVSLAAAFKRVEPTGPPRLMSISANNERGRN